MNATQWETLTDFTKWLGREGGHETLFGQCYAAALQEGERCVFCVRVWKTRGAGQLETGGLIFGLLLCPPVV